MALRNIVYSDSQNIRKKSKEVAVFDESFWQLLDDMKETMHKNNGCGIAAPQVGVLKRAVLVEVNNIFLELINPVIVGQQGKQCEKEGCLSVKGVTGFVERPKIVTVSALDRYGNPYKITATEYLAVALCHEIDHLDGVLFIDKILPNYKPLSEEVE